MWFNPLTKHCELPALYRETEIKSSILMVVGGWWLVVGGEVGNADRIWSSTPQNLASGSADGRGVCRDSKIPPTDDGWWLVVSGELDHIASGSADGRGFVGKCKAKTNCALIAQFGNPA